MRGNINLRKICLASALSLILIMSSVNAFAGDRDDDRNINRGRHEKRREIVVVGHDRYYYHDGRFFRPSWFGLEIALLTPPIGAVVASIPLGRRVVLVGGFTYYYYNNVYYKSCPNGYLVVPAPVAVVSPAPAVVNVPAPAYIAAPAPQTVVINVPNSNGSYTPVTLTKSGNGYVGPQGEFYSQHPTVDQLKALYGN